MSVRVITAPPGYGKTFNMTRFALKRFKSDNPLLERKFKKLIGKKYVYQNKIYSNYPIMLREFKKPVYWVDGAGVEHYSSKIYSNKVRLTDMRLKFSFCDGASFYIDEIQYMYDSQEYSSFPDCIAHFFQVHRHLSYNDIYTNSQSLSRVIKKVLCVSEEFLNIISFHLFLGLIGRVKFKITYDVNMSKNSENSDVPDDKVDIVVRWFRCKPLFKAYDTKYLKALNDNLPRYDQGNWDSLYVPKKEILDSFLISKNLKDELFKQEF